MELGEVIENAKLPAVTTGVVFDADKMAVQGVYRDQLAAYRAKKLWSSALQKNFLLEAGHDFALDVNSSLETHVFVLRCDFLTACGRYAFWRLTHSQAPEVQYLMEIAHVPQPLSLDMPEIRQAMPGFKGEKVKLILGHLWNKLRKSISSRSK